jgi:16S rRNA G1207 methylase RsmC
MAELAELEDGLRILEPSAGTGQLVKAAKACAPGARVQAVEVNHNLALQLEREGGCDVRCDDFLSCDLEHLGRFDRILMNPPFERAADVVHILHARKFLAPGGRLVAVCAGGPAQAARLQPLADSWEPLPAGTFKAAGTNVHTVLLTMSAEEVA